MDIDSNEQSSLVFHRIRGGSSTTPFSVQTSRDIKSNGIASLVDYAYSPPGVLTKFDSSNTKKHIISPSKPKTMICSNCFKKVSCYCKKCTLEKLQIYSKRGNLVVKTEEKKKLQTEIINKMDNLISLRSIVSLTEGKLLNLRKKVEKMKLKIAIKREECERLEEVRPTMATSSQFQAIFDRHDIYFRDSSLWKKRGIEKLNEAEKNLAKKREEYCRTACFLFPVKEFDVNIESVTTMTNNSSNWAVVNDRIDEGRRFTIRGASTNEQLRKRLSASLSKGTISLPTDLHQPFAAFTNTVQLVHLLNSIFNFRPPVQTYYRELCIRMNWSKEIMNNDWNALCTSVIYLCAYIGMNPSKLIYKNPHFNLIEFTSFVCKNGNIMKIGGRPNPDLSEVQKIIMNQEPEETISCEYEDQSWEIVN